MSPLKRLTGYTTDISEWLEFKFYDLVWYWDNQNDSNETKIGLWIGVSNKLGIAKCY